MWLLNTAFRSSDSTQLNGMQEIAHVPSLAKVCLILQVKDNQI